MTNYTEDPRKIVYYCQSCYHPIMDTPTIVDYGKPCSRCGCLEDWPEVPTEPRQEGCSYPNIVYSYPINMKYKKWKQGVIYSL